MVPGLELPKLVGASGAIQLRSSRRNSAISGPEVYYHHFDLLAVFVKSSHGLEGCGTRRQDHHTVGTDQSIGRASTRRLVARWAHATIGAVSLRRGKGML